MQYDNEKCKRCYSKKYYTGVLHISVKYFTFVKLYIYIYMDLLHRYLFLL